MENIPIVAFNRGNARVAVGNNYYIHHFNVSSIQHEIRILSAEFSSLEETQFTTIIEQEFTNANDMLKNTFPIHRSKRWDTIGTVWKFIAGSPDADDLRLINSTINDLINNNNVQVKINNDLTLQLTETLGRIKEALKFSRDTSVDLFSINILLNLRYLSEKLGLVTDSIALAKLGITNSRILNRKEIDLLISDLRKQDLPIHTVTEALSYTNTKIATNNNEILFIISCPRLTNDYYKKIEIYPVTNNCKKVHVPNQYYLSLKSQFSIIPNVEKLIYDIKDLQRDNGKCIPALLQGESAICDYVSNPAKTEIIHLDMNHLLIDAVSTFTLKTTCGVKKRNLTGSFLITYEACNIFIDEKLISNNKTEMFGSPLNLPIYGIKVTPKNSVINLSLEHLHSLHKELRNEMQEIRLETNSITWNGFHISIISLPLLLIIITCIYLGIKLWKGKTVINIHEPATQNPVPNNEFNENNYNPPTMMHVFRTEPQI
uniref:Envelope protein n=1 Tax=Panta errantivirus TaxID=3078412 RepID=A0AB38Z2P4_9VIRU